MHEQDGVQQEGNGEDGGDDSDDLPAAAGSGISSGIGMEHLAAAARAQNATGLERLARRVRPSVTWDDLFLPVRTGIALRHLAGRAAHRDTVLDEWGLRRGGGRGEGVTALFAGESGTGKTMVAEVVAGLLGVDLYVIDLVDVVHGSAMQQIHAS
ncbi:AAA family ATPase [Protofrankia symbiont of Coriaria ruscifolia]|uniref:AAA family ATPase n=1 Tax=Protofrankia symbiont of Coriaria ruscifolia TaxID=1306542 RepID=UPI001A946872|nr:AAA family ATPase [Protofrankia symbiont of Coriaria ruscifolia]